MMKAVLISIRPKECELIVTGKKTVEVRKTKPKLKTPFKCYVYETKAYDTLFGKGKPKKLCVGGGRVIGEFICSNIAKGFSQVGSCLSMQEINDYANGKEVYGWCISDLVIYDKPRELSEFYVLDDKAIKECEHRERIYVNPDSVNGAWLKGSYICTKGEEDWCSKCKTKPITRPPQSWCYIEHPTEKGGEG